MRCWYSLGCAKIPPTCPVSGNSTTARSAGVLIQSAVHKRLWFLIAGDEQNRAGRDFFNQHDERLGRNAAHQVRHSVVHPPHRRGDIHEAILGWQWQNILYRVSAGASETSALREVSSAAAWRMTCAPSESPTAPMRSGQPLSGCASRSPRL